MNWYRKAQQIEDLGERQGYRDDIHNTTYEERLKDCRERMGWEYDQTRILTQSLEPVRRGTYELPTEAQLKEKAREKKLLDELTETRIEEDPKLYIDRRPPVLVKGDHRLLNLYWKLDPHSNENTGRPDNAVLEKILSRKV